MYPIYRPAGATEFLFVFSGGSEDSTPGFMLLPAPGLKTNNTWLRLFYSLADSEDVTVRVAYMHLADTPRLVGGRPGDLDTLFKTVLVDGIDVVDPDRHPDAMVLAVGKSPRRCQIAFARDHPARPDTGRSRTRQSRHRRR